MKNRSLREEYDALADDLYAARCRVTEQLTKDDDHVVALRMFNADLVSALNKMTVFLSRHPAFRSLHKELEAAVL